MEESKVEECLQLEFTGRQEPSPKVVLEHQTRTASRLLGYGLRERGETRARLLTQEIDHKRLSQPSLPNPIR